MKASLVKVIACGCVVMLAVPATATDLDVPVNVDRQEAIYLTYGTDGVFFTWGRDGDFNFIPDGLNIGGDLKPPKTGLLVRGRTGIGTQNPLSELHVKGKGKFADVTISPDASNETSRLVMCQDPNCKAASLLRYDGEHDSLFLYFKGAGSNGYSRDRISLKVEHHANSAARVGINVPKDHDIKHALEVNGTILAEEIEVVPVVADYVFADNFHLMSLEKVAAFIKTNQHLPGIPSKSDIAQQGGKVPLGQAFTQMLQKIEELTLYTIEQHNTLNEQKRLLTAQREQLQEMQAEIRALRKMLSSNVN